MTCLQLGAEAGGEVEAPSRDRVRAVVGCHAGRKSRVGLAVEPRDEDEVGEDVADDEGGGGLRRAD